MLLVGTQPLRSQHPPLTALPLGSAKTSPRWLEATLQVKKDVRREALYLGLLLLLLLLESDGRACFSAARRNREGTNSWKCYAGVPSLSAFLNPPTLRPSPSQALSHAGPHQLCTRLLFWLFKNVFIIYFCCTPRMTQTSTQQHTSRFLPPPPFLGQVDD